AFAVFAALAFSTAASAQNELVWEAFNDYRPGDNTSENASDYDLRITDDGGPLRDIATGDELDAEVIVIAEGTPDDFGLNSPLNEGSPGDLLFGDFVEIGNDGLPGVRSGTSSLSLVFQNLDPNKRYSFRGTTSRGGNYDDRWTLFRIAATDAHVSAHVDGSDRQNLITKESFPDADLTEDEVALNSGDNKVGSLIGWDNIEPGADGEFSIDAEQYTGEAPFGNPGGGPYGYGFSAIYLAQYESSGDLRITENPKATRVIAAGSTTTLSVAATSPDAITYQWQRAEVAGEEFEDIAGATAVSYETPVLTIEDDGANYRCVVSSDGNSTFSGVAIVSVDGEVPEIENVFASVNFNAVYVSFSEAMRLDLLADRGNYQISGGLTVGSVVVLDASNVRLVTSAQPKGGSFSVTLANLTDLAGNPVAAGNSDFKSFALANGVVGLEIWQNILGGAVQDLRDNPRFPDSPSIDYSTTKIDSTEVFADGPNNTYGGRFRGWLIPDETAEYEFFLRADDNGEFSISGDDQFGGLDDPNRFPDIEAGGNLPFEIPSDPIALEAGKKYAVQVLWKEANGGDIAQLAWRKVGDDELPEDPIPSEFFCYFGPNAPDVDADGMSDVYEALYGLDPAVDDSAGDLDSDGLSNAEEHTLGTAANSDDTDGDGLKDGVESGTGVFVSANDTGTSPLSSDTDRDGLSDGVETRTGVFVDASNTGSDPLNRDTDGDGASDGLEVSSGFDPNNAASIPSVVQGGGVFLTSHVWTDGDPEILDIFEAEDILADEGRGGERFVADTRFIHFHDSVEPPIFIEESRPFPLWDDENGGEGGFGDRDNFAIHSAGQINITQAGLVSFICNSDDGFVLRIDGDDVGEAGDRGRADTLMEVDLTAGVHDIEFIYYERGGGAGVSLFVYRGLGVAPELNDSEWELLPAFGGGSKSFEIINVQRDGDMVTFSWPSAVGEQFIVEKAADLEDWEEVTDGHPSGGASTTYELDVSGDAGELYIRVTRE
ncbi:MAG: hypothetical protein ACI9R3_006585, partial [Verrucomicrobiales bacterium]